jgi:hypothetical protein
MSSKSTTYYNHFFRQGLTILLVSTAIVATAQPVLASNTSLYIGQNTTVVDGREAPFNALEPGDTLKILAGVRDQLLITHLNGSAQKPLVVQNAGGSVQLSTSNHYGMSIRHSRYLQITGSGCSSAFYGIQILNVDNGAGIGINDLSSDIELDHISIAHTMFSGISAKTDPDLSTLSSRHQFTQFNTVIHDCSISDTGNEGMYIGNTKYDGILEQVNGVDTLIYPSLLEGVRIYNNILCRTGWDGIQVSSAHKDCQVYGNIITYDSQDEYFSQLSGIMLGGGSKCDCFNNYIADGKGSGIEVHGLGGFRIFNNIIVNAGRTNHPLDLTDRGYGIFVSDISVEKDSSFILAFNDILNPKTDGIRFTSTKSRNNIIASNLIVNPGAYDLYENDNTAAVGTDAYVMIPNDSSEVALHNNYFTRSLQDAHIDSITYTPYVYSPLIDAAWNNALGVSFDKSNVPRLSGSGYDVGAMEYQQTSDEKNRWPLFANPVSTQLTIKYLSNNNTDAFLRIYTKAGALLMEKRQSYQAQAIQEIGIAIGHLRADLYLFSIISGNDRYSGKFIKNN